MSNPTTAQRAAITPQQLRAELPSQDCNACRADSVVYVRCGRGDCAASELQRAAAAARIEALEAALQALSERCFKRNLFPNEVKAAFEAMPIEKPAR